jgi:hypothetical protein
MGCRIGLVDWWDFGVSSRSIRRRGWVAASDTGDQRAPAAISRWYSESSGRFQGHEEARDSMKSPDRSKIGLGVLHVSMDRKDEAARREAWMACSPLGLAHFRKGGLYLEAYPGLLDAILRYRSGTPLQRMGKRSTTIPSLRAVSLWKSKPAAGSGSGQAGNVQGQHTRPRPGRPQALLHRSYPGVPSPLWLDEQWCRFHSRAPRDELTRPSILAESIQAAGHADKTRTKKVLGTLACSCDQGGNAVDHLNAWR